MLWPLFAAVFPRLAPSQFVLGIVLEGAVIVGSRDHLKAPPLRVDTINLRASPTVCLDGATCCDSITFWAHEANTCKHMPSYASCHTTLASAARGTKGVGGGNHAVVIRCNNGR